MSPPSRTEPATAVATLAAAAAIAVAALLAYANAPGGSFQFDDWNVVVGDPRVQSLAAWWHAMPGIRPLLKLSYAAGHEAGAGARGFHAFNLAAHVANALLVLALLRRWRPGEPPWPREVAATVAALVFALHPVQTEAVTYVAGRSVSLAATFALASLLAWVAGRERGNRWLAGALSPLLFACALATRETAAVLPAAMVLWRVTAGRPAGDGASALEATAGHWVVLAAMAAFALALPDYQRFFATSLGARPLMAQLLTQVNAVSYLAGQLLRFDRLNADPMLPVITLLTPALAARALVLTGAIAIGIASLRRRPALAFGVLWFFLWLAPTNSLLPRLDVVNDRQLYLALVGPAWLVGVGIAALWKWRAWAGAVLVALLVLGLGSATRARNEVYADEVGFWQDVTQKTPGNARAFNNLGYAFALAGRDADAEQAFRRALAADPAYTKAAVNLVMLRNGKLLTGDEGRKSR